MLEVEVRGSIATLTLSRPAALNAIDAELLSQLQSAWRRLDEDDTVRCAVLRGAGERAFCAGADLQDVTTGRDLSALGLLHSAKPVIAAIDGYALGAGLELALLCDVRIASTRAQLGLPEVRRGLVPAAGGVQRLLRTLGGSDAMLALLTGDTLDADAALRCGLVSQVVAPEHLEDTARAIAARIAANAPLAVRAVKRLAEAAREDTPPAHLARAATELRALRGSEDAAEGRRAFREKRPPRFTGR